MFILQFYQTEWGVVKNVRFVGPFNTIPEAHAYGDSFSGWQYYVQQLLSTQEWERMEATI